MQSFCESRLLGVNITENLCYNLNLVRCGVFQLFVAEVSMENVQTLL